MSPPPTVQSRRFLNEPGRPPAYSGVQIRIASASLTAARSAATSGCSGSRSSSGLKCGRAPRPVYVRLAVSVATVPSTAALPEPARRLPQISRITRPVCQRKPGDALVSLDVPVTRGRHHFGRQRRQRRPAVPAGRRIDQPVAHVLLVERRLRDAGLVTV